MPYVTPFKAITYHPQTFPDISALITPPYDNIPPGEDQKYWSRSPYSFAHIDLPHKPEDDYTEASRKISLWVEKGIFKETSAPCYFLYEQSFSAYGQTHRRRTLMATVFLHEFKDRVILPHENTHGKHKADRLQIMRATQFNLSHIFGMVKDTEGYLESLYDRWAFEPVFLKGKSDDGSTHSIWKIEAPKATEITPFFESKPIYIVDGHHRYESSVQYAREKGALGKKDHPAAYTLFAIANGCDPGLIVFPTHRLVKPGFGGGVTVKALESDFTLTPMELPELERFVSTPVETPEFGLYLESKLYRCRPNHWQSMNSNWGKSVTRLPVAWSDEKILKERCGIGEQERAQKLIYERDFTSAWGKRNEQDLVIFQPRPAIREVTEVADEGRFMPQKSTFFFPKLAAGIALRRIG